MQLRTLFGSFLVLVVWTVIPASAQETFDWDALTATDSLEWTSCYSDLQCTLLQVPLDYTFQDKRNASIAIVRVPATAPAEEYLGPILFNPGGPGNSGVSTIVSAGPAFAEFLGPRFDIVGFDPRGVSFSKPAATLFDSDVQRAFWIPEDANIRYHSLNASRDALPNYWAQYQLVGQKAKLHDTENVLQYLTTDNIAADMLSITEAFGFEKLQYWGVSYGSVLGQTFATLFPDKVGRIAIDGVVDGEAWFSGSMTDTDKVLEMFFTGCFNAGPASCAYYDSSPAKIAANFESLLQTLREEPIPVLTDISHGVVDFSFLRVVTLSTLLSPYGTLPNLAERLAELSAGNGTTIYTQNQAASVECDCASNPQATDATIFESQLAIACGDAGPIHDSIAQLRAFYENEAKLSSFADIWSSWRVRCAGWQVHREDRFQGPMGANTSFPLLLIGNTADPTTPRMWAQKVSTVFPGSVLLTQDSGGHTSLAAPSSCTHGALAAYFQNGTLPAVGTVCPVDVEMFPSTTTAAKRADNLKLLDAIEKIHSAVRSQARIA
ncbi:TAP-like protein-domain-containing protein [Mycena amicta]|nr:TAP-like protein-domain-containing protein [Mycena amicta]